MYFSLSNIIERSIKTSMERWIGKVAVVTGASSGIGAAIAVDLTKAGMIVVGVARRSERVDELWNKLKKENSEITGTLHSFKCDLTSESDIKSVFKWVDEKFGRIDVLINNAGIVKKMNIVDADNTAQLREVIDTNVMGVAFCTREAFQLMQKYNINDGHVIIINSVAGHSVPYIFAKYGSLNIYPPSKYAVTAMTEVLRQEFQLFKTKTKITSISPGGVATEIIPPESLKIIEQNNMPILKSEDVSEAVLYVLGTPPHVQVHELIIRPVGEAF